MADVEIEVTQYREYATTRLKELGALFERLFEVIETQEATIEELENE